MRLTHGLHDTVDRAVIDRPRAALMCHLIGHSRSRVFLFTQGDGVWRSRCKRCGDKMVRSHHGHWALDLTH